jgi:hypothetical protein
MKAGKKNRVLAIAAALAALVATALVFAPAAFEVSTKNSLDAYVIAGTKGPLVMCQDANTCDHRDTVWEYIYVANGNDVTNLGGATNRATLPNSFIVNSVDQRTYVDGQPYPAFDFTYTPPPNPSIRSWSGHWPATVTCGTPAPDPCTNLQAPAVIPGENVAILYFGWSHGTGEPDGNYVFEFTIHGSLNGESVDLVTRSKSIAMTT